MEYRTCNGCEHILRENAGKGNEFLICNLGKFDRACRPVMERVKKGREATTPIPVWCKLGLGKIRG